MRINLHYNENESIIEDDLRKIVGIKTKYGEITWDDIADYVFVLFDEYSLDFKREVKKNYLEEVKKNYPNDENAIKEAKKKIVNNIIDAVSSCLGNYSYEACYGYIELLKDNNIFEFFDLQYFFLIFFVTSMI